MSHSNSPTPSPRRRKKTDSLKGFKFIDLGSIAEMRRSEISEYIGKLHKLLKKTGKKMKKYKERWLKKKRSKDESDSSSSEDEQSTAATLTPTDDISAVKCDDLVTATPVDEDPLSFVDDMKRTAEQMAGFVFEPTSGLYYDCKTGYYYNAELGLYYDGNTACYYELRANKFVFHSQAYAEMPAADAQSQCSTKGPCKPDDNKSKVEYRSHHQTSNVHPSASNQRATSRPTIDHLLRQMSRLDIGRCRGNALDIARKYPPSLRLVVLETVQPKLRVGQLFMITYKGGSLGREGAHDVIIPDINVSKFHLTFKYNHDESHYECTDLGSRNGTVLNGRRMSNCKQESEPQPLLHGAIIGLSQTRLLCHVHEGHTTCDECEPGMRASVAPAGGGATSSTAEVTTDGAYLTHKQELKQLKKRYGLADQKYLIQQSTMGNDRSAQRRALVGSSDGNEKTQVASVDTNISTNNKGFKMLAKLGWSQGQKLGKNDSGLLEPIPLVSNTGSKGLGCEEFVPSVPASNTVQKRAEQMRKTQQERFNRNAAHDIFGDDGELDV